MIYPLSQGCHDAIPMADYHGLEICPGPSISSSGLREILRCPLKYWHYSTLNPNRPPREHKQVFSLGTAAHALISDGIDGLNKIVHRLPPGFNASATVKFADAIAERDEAVAAGKLVLKDDEYNDVLGMASALLAHPISRVFSRGLIEQTLIWRDRETGVYLRARPDYLPWDRQAIPDYKTTVSAHPAEFSRSVAVYSYHQQAALYLDGIEAVFGDRPRSFYFIAQEKTPPYIVQPMELSSDAIALGREENRRAIRTFARCLETNTWPGYADDFVMVDVPAWRKRQAETTCEELL